MNYLHWWKELTILRKGRDHAAHAHYIVVRCDVPALHH
jgi:hypothetical protein